MLRLNYIGCKYQLLEWIETCMLEKTGWESVLGKKIADLFAGTGSVSYYFRTRGAIPISNDAELYSSLITQAATQCAYTDECKQWIDRLNNNERHIGLITRHYSPYLDCERMYWTIENAQRIDWIRNQIEEIKGTSLYTFLLASLLLSADAVSNVPAVYGCYLKTFKKQALKPIVLTPIHTLTTPCLPETAVFQQDVLTLCVRADAVYLDPPYNERQYSKNYFPLNVLAGPPDAPMDLHGKTGIPSDCFVSPFCKKRSVESAFRQLLKNLSSPWVFLSYNSESLVSKERMVELLSEYGDVSVIEKNQTRFKNFSYNGDKALQEYLFCVKMHLPETTLDRAQEDSSNQTET